jgi:hypothetical protein
LDEVIRSDIVDQLVVTTNAGSTLEDLANTMLSGDMLASHSAQPGVEGRPLDLWHPRTLAPSDPSMNLPLAALSFPEGGVLVEIKCPFRSGPAGAPVGRTLNNRTAVELGLMEAPREGRRKRRRRGKREERRGGRR